jgi:DNA-binding MarR family transcriptional regulator
MPPPERLWADFSFVVSSRYRERVLSALSEKPKLPAQLAHETRVRIFHVSRALRELSGRRLVVCLTPELSGRGRLYGLTEEGAHLLQQILGPSRYPATAPPRAGTSSEFVPKIRASSVLRFVRFLRTEHAGPPVDAILREWGVQLSELTEDSWLPVTAAARLLELVERGLGDGSYSFIRSAFGRAVVQFPTIQEQLSRVVPISALARRAPAVYGKEWNYGRLTVETHGHKAVMRHYDWMPTPAMCAMFHGIYEGIMSARGVSGSVVKSSCVRSGSDCCEYRVSW